MPFGAGNFPNSGPNGRTLGGAYRHLRGKYAFTNSSGLGEITVPETAFIGAITGTTDVPDITYNQAANVTLFKAARVPPNMRIYPTRIWAQVLGATAWTNTSGTNPGLVVVDTSSLLLPAAYFPLTSLVPGAFINLPKGTSIPFLIGSGQTITATYSAAGPTITGSGAFVVTTLLGNCYVTIVDDATTPTAVGQSMRIASQASTTVLTLAAAFPIAPSTAAVYAIQYFTTTSGSATTAVIPNAVNVAANQAQGYSLVIAQGTGAGQTSVVTTNTTTTMTIASRATAPASGSLFLLNTDPSNLGAVDFGLANSSIQLSLGAGLQVALVGVQAGGSAVRIGFEGFLAV